MTVFVMYSEYWEDTTIDGVFVSMEAAQASAPSLTWVKCGDGVEASELPYGSRTMIQPFEVQE